jgi:hypothetical protein
VTTGTKSLLFGCHQFLIHPAFVLAAWWRLYGRPSWRMALAILVHDWGYWGCEQMDKGPGERHAERMGWRVLPWLGVAASTEILAHSRFTARRLGVAPSRLCWADKLGTAWYPVWLWVLLARVSGELGEYMADTKYEIHVVDGAKWAVRDTPRAFFRRYQAKVAEWRASNWKSAEVKG